MFVRVVLDQPANVAYTNLDIISGQVVIRTPKSENINSVVVKLEGESRTRLMSAPGPNGERPKPMIEYHKLLYRVQMVFPDAHAAEGRSTMTMGRTAYCLPPGEHIYPFSFKVHHGALRTLLARRATDGLYYRSHSTTTAPRTACSSQRLWAWKSQDLRLGMSRRRCRPR